MTTTELKHIETNIDVINVWIKNNTKLQYSDITKPIFEAYERETGFSPAACDSCKIDALIWARMEFRKNDLPTYKAIGGEITSVILTNDQIVPFVKVTPKHKTKKK